MTTDLIQHAFHGQAVRVITDEHGDPWFVLADLCAALGITNGRNVAARLDDDMKGVRPVDTLGGRQSLTVVTEPGMYDVVFRSDSPMAKPFRHWVTTEVLPSIRRTGSYGSVAALGARDILAIVQRLVEQEERTYRAERVVHAIEAADGLTSTEFHKHYFSDVRESDFFAALYRHHLLIDQRGARGRDTKGRLKNGREHQHPRALGKAFFYLHGRLDSEGVRRESVRVRPGRPEVELVEFLAGKGLTPNTNAMTTTREIAA